MSKRIITLGTWEGKPIEWIVLKKEGIFSLVITKTNLGGSRRFHSSSNSNWEHSDMRKFLNEEFFNNAFSSDEKKKIVNTVISSPNNTKDDVFLLDKSEAETLIKNDDEYFNDVRCDHSWCCWYRTPRNSSNVYIGYPNLCSCYPNASDNFAIRPVMYIKE